MTASRRIGTTGSKTRVLLVDAAEALMLEEGYAAVTSRRVGAKAGVSSQLVHYYFVTMDDLYLEVFRRRAEEGLATFAKRMAAEPSLRSIWEFRNDAASAAFNIEFTALANHRKAIRAEIARYAERFRSMQLQAVTAVLADHGLDAETWTPIVVLLAMMGVTQFMAIEESLGVTAGHAEVLAYIERTIDELERRPPA